MPHSMRGARNREGEVGAARPAERGSALVEFALVLPFLLILVFAVVDVGQLVQTRLILTNVAREGGSIGSRQDSLDVNLPALLVASGRPLDLSGADGKLIVTRIRSGQSSAQPLPTVERRMQTGGFAASSGVGSGLANFGLTSTIYNHLVFNSVNGIADISSVTVVETYFKYRPITPLSNFLPNLLTPDGGGLILRSRAVF
jgi:Flp pilus assembly protein TadG